MKPEQLNWSDAQWAAYLGCAATDIPRIRQWVEENYCPSIVRHWSGKQYSFVLTRRYDTPSGWTRFLPIVESAQYFGTPTQATEYANRKIIPNLQMTEFWARVNRVPSGALQMLHINEKQK